MLAKLGSIDFGKWALNTSSGFVVAAAVMFVIDSLVGGHRIESLLSDINAGKVIIFALGAIVSSSILGLMLDSIYGTLGRWYSKQYWKPLQYEFAFRKGVMKEIGLINKDFEWMYASCKDKLTADIEQKYLRFTEVAGSTGYTMMIFLCPATFMFLRLEYDISYRFSMGVGIFVAVCGLILLLTSAQSLSKYEMKKTSLVMDDIRRLNARFNVDKVIDKCKKDILHPLSYFKGAVCLLGIIVISALMLFGSHFIATWRTSEVNMMSKLALISEVGNGETDVSGVPTINIVVNKELTTPGDLAASMVVILNDKFNRAKDIHLKYSNLANLIDPKPKWKLTVNLFNTTGVAVGTRVYINTYLSFVDSSGNTISSNNIALGEWLFPVIVTIDDNTEYLLAQVHVTIKAASPSVDEEESESNNTTTTESPP